MGWPWVSAKRLRRAKRDAADAQYSAKQWERTCREQRERINGLRSQITELERHPRDEYHTMDELYDYRMVYHAMFCAEIAGTTIQAYRSFKHSDGQLCFGGGWFIVVVELPTGQVSNHYKSQYWHMFDSVPEVEVPPPYDGHTPDLALIRMKAYLDGVRHRIGDWAKPMVKE